jgi:hypothetical protein
VARATGGSRWNSARSIASVTPAHLTATPYQSVQIAASRAPFRLARRAL